MNRRPSRFQLALVAAALAVGTIACYWPATGYGFVNYDDNDYVYENPRVQAGPSWPLVRWAFTTGHAGNYHPLTWLSLAADGPAPTSEALASAMHRTNVLLHAANVALLFLALAIGTGAMAPSVVVAAVFAVHPVHVESVAWVAERKDVLCGFFYLSTVLAHVVIDRPRWRPVATTVLGTAALLSKPMAVSLPLALLLLDAWPLRRPLTAWRAVRPQLVLLALAAVLCVVTYQVQSAARAVQSLEAIPAAQRAQVVPVAYARYLGLFFWPVRLSVFYPYPLSLPLSAVGSSVAGLALLTLDAVRSVGRRPYFTVGWLWFVLTLVPVVGVVQVGWQSLADRYMYLPLIGPAVVVVWAVRERLPWRWARVGMAVAAVVTLTVLMRRQLPYWHDTDKLFRRSLAVAPENPVAHAQLGYQARLRGDDADAERHYAEAVRLVSRYGEVAFSLGVLLQPKDPHAAARYYELALRSMPDNPMVENNLGFVLTDDDPARAGQLLHAAAAASPTWAVPHVNLGHLLLTHGRPADAAGEYRAALRLDPSSAPAHAGLARAVDAARTPTTRRPGDRRG